MRDERLTPGRELVSEPRTVSVTDIEAFAELSGDRNPLHLDAAAAREAGFAAPIAHGALGIAVATGLVSSLGITRGILVAMLELRWQFVAPVRAGDTLRARVTVDEVRATSRLDRRVVVLHIAVVDSAGEVRQRGELVELVRHDDDAR
jgi:acyl dehydratase